MSAAEDKAVGSTEAEAGPEAGRLGSPEERSAAVATEAAVEVATVEAALAEAVTAVVVMAAAATAAAAKGAEGTAGAGAVGVVKAAAAAEAGSMGAEAEPAADGKGYRAGSLEAATRVEARAAAGLAVAAMAVVDSA